MSYVKNYNVGQIKLDLPSPNYYYNLPLLSFGDIYGSVNLSLVFNYTMKNNNDNNYHIANGFKLNLHKRIIRNMGGTPISFENSNGTTVNLYQTDNIFTFDDDTRRIIRKVGDSYELENPDFSKEVYNSYGMLVEVYDKYGELIYSYGYTTHGKPNYILYRNSKQIDFIYNSSDNLYVIRYENNSILIRYESNALNISHYNGVNFNLNFSSNNFIATSSSVEDSTTITHCTKIEIPENNFNTLKITNSIGSNVIDETSYAFSDNIIDQIGDTIDCEKQYNQVEITNKNGVKIRTQYQYNLPLYSYEINSNGEYADGDITIYRSIEDWETNDINNNMVGTINRNAGWPMYHTDTTLDKWGFNLCYYHDGQTNGYCIVSGWIKSKGTYPSSPICISKGGGSIDFKFTPNISPYNQWKYFAYKFYMPANFIYVFPENSNYVELKDLKIIFQPTPVIENSDNTHNMAIEEDILVYHGGSGYEYIPLNNTLFMFGDEYVLDYGYTYFDDILKYKLNKKRNQNTNEIYYDKCKEVIFSSNELTVIHNDTPISINDFYLGKRQYTSTGMITTIFKDDTSNFLVCETRNTNGDIILSKIFNNKLDIISETVNGITTTYTRYNGLLRSESVSGLYTRTISYDSNANEDPIITETDEFDNSTTYALDPIWGNIKSITLPNGQIITDDFDSDGCAKIRRTFVSGGRSNIYRYFGGNLSKIQNSRISYDLTYSNGDLTSVKKNNALIEEHEITDTQINSYYPSKSNALNTDKQTFDKYGRLISVDGVLTNTYKLDPNYDLGVYDFWDINNASSKLAISTDHTTGNIRKFAYKDNKLSRSAVFDSSNTKLSEEVFEFDKAGRIKLDKYTFSNGDTIFDSKNYVTSETSMNPDTRVNQYIFCHNELSKVSSINYYDNLKRLSQKNITVGANSISKTFNYDSTKLCGITHSKNNSTLHNYTWNSDGMLRTTSESDNVNGGYTNSYVYDNYGQLTRENNGHFGKTILYTYDNIGNITKAQKYNYTTGAVSGTPTEDTYTYSTVYPDRLTTFNNKNIEYDDNGCVKTYDGRTYNWHKGKLSSINKSTVNSSQRIFIGGITEDYTFKYNAYGQRIEKKYTYFPGSIQQNEYLANCTSTYEYDLNGRLLSDTRELRYSDGSTINKKFVFIYEESDIVGVIFTNSSGTGIYYYDKNPRGDVIAILDNSGNTVVKYRYDAYGNCTCYYSTNNDLEQSNPIRYRSYYYDEDTGLYYLNARYYNPQWRRFISPARTSTINVDAVNGLNLYVYANSNPIGIAYRSFGAGGIASSGMVSSIGASNSFVGQTNPGSLSKDRLNPGWLVNGLNTGSTIYGLYTSTSGLVNHTAYFVENLAPFMDDMTILGASMKDGVLAFNQFNWGLGKSDILGVMLGVGLDIYDSAQREVSPSGVAFGATLTAAKSVGLIYLNKGILYGATASGSAICPGVGTVVGFVVGGVVCIVVDIFVSNWLDDLIDKIAK